MLKQLPSVVRLPSLLIFVILLTGATASLSAKDTWTQIRSKNFIIVGNASERELRKTAVHLEQYREALSKLLPKAKLNSSVPTTVMVFATDSSFQPFKPQYRGKTKSDIAGYFLSGADRNYIVLTLDNHWPDPYHVIFHEYFHFLVGNNLAHAAAWLNEGLAEFYSSFQTFDNDQKFRIGLPIDSHLRVLNSRSLMPLKTLLTADRSSPEYNDPNRVAVFYAESWTLVHYLMLGNKGARRPQFDQFINLLNAGQPVEESFRQSFQADYKKIEDELRIYTSLHLYPVWELTLRNPLEIDKEMQSSALAEAEVQYYQGDLLLRNHRMEEAEAHLKKSLDLAPDAAEAQISLAILRLQQQKPEEAKKLLESAIAADAKNYLGPFYYAEALSQEEKYEDALPYYKQALALKSDAADVRTGLGFAYTALGQEKNAQSEFKLVQALAPASSDYYHSRSFNYLKLGQGALAARAALLALDLKGWREESAMYMVLTAHFGFRQGHNDAEAAQILKKATTVVDTTRWPYPVMRYLEREIGEKELLAQATDNDKQTEAHTYLGLDLSLMGKRDEAINHLRWVKEKGNKHFYEYPVAVTELERLEKNASKSAQ